MDITRNNYELYAVDFIDGALSPTEVAEFMVFLANNPDIADEIEIIREASLERDQDCKSVDFSFLKKDLNSSEINENNFEEYCIAYHENDLLDSSKEKLHHFIETNPLFEPQFELYGKLKLTPDSNIFFPKKKLLKKKVVHLSPKMLKPAAVILLAASFLVFFVLKMPKITDKTNSEIKTVDYQLADLEKVSVENQIDKEPASIEGTKKRKTKTNSKPNKSIIAVTDTLQLPRHEFIHVSMVEVRKIEQSLQDKGIKGRSESLYQASKDDGKLPESGKEKNQKVWDKVANIKLNDIIRTSINGINQLAETDLKYESKTDGQGRVTEYALSSDNFNIRRKLRN